MSLDEWMAEMAAAATSGRIVVPDVQDLDTCTAALAYAAAGFYVLPVRRGEKNPGSRVGAQWHLKSTRDPREIIAYWAGSDDGIALHLGPSRLLAFDVDRPEHLPPVLLQAIQDASPPFQATRSDGSGRVHYLFSIPAGSTFGNGTGALGGKWGEVRGQNGVIIVEPSVHANANEGGAYRWQQTGPVPMLPNSVAVLLPASSPAADSATDETVSAFLAEHVGNDRPDLLSKLCGAFTNKVRGGASRHTSAVSALTGAMKEARCGYYPAREADERLRRWFVEAVTDPSKPNQRSESQALAEWAAIRSWSVSQALSADPGDVAERVALVDASDVLPGLLAAAPQGVDAETGEILPTLGTPPEPSPAAPRLAVDEPSFGDSWVPLDVRATVDGLLAGTTTRPEPTVFRRSDGQALFYSAKVNGVAGASGDGKSLVVQYACAQEMHDGNAVVYVDLEDDAASVLSRLLDMGVDPLILADLFTYISPDEPYGAEAQAHLEGVVRARRPSLVVIDSTGESLALDGAKPNDDDDVARWFRKLPTALARLGPAVVVIDHMAKADDGSLSPIGSQRKRAAISGAQYITSQVTSFSKAQPGKVNLICGKDRAGTFRRGQTAAEVAVTPGANGEILVNVDAPEAGDGATFRPTYLMERVSLYVETEARPLSQRTIKKKVSGNGSAIVAALRVLVEEGYVAQTKAGTAYLHTHVKPYRETLELVDTSTPGPPGPTGSSTGPGLARETPGPPGPPGY